MSRNDLFALALEKGEAFMDLGSMKIYRFDEYAKFKSKGWPTSGVYITDSDGVICDLWEESSVAIYIENLDLKPVWQAKTEAS